MDRRTELIDRPYPEMARGPKTVGNTEKKEIKRKNTYKLKKFNFQEKLSKFQKETQRGNKKMDGK